MIDEVDLGCIRHHRQNQYGLPMFVFYRKERPEVFATRFSAPTSPTEAWSLRSNVIFQAKNVSGKEFSVTHNGQSVKLSCTVNGTSLAFKTVDTRQANSFTIAESEMAELLARKPDSLKYLALAKICRDHATKLQVFALDIRLRCQQFPRKHELSGT